MIDRVQRDHRVRFAAVGVAMTLLHLALFALVAPHALPEVANAVAFLVATQVNFLASYHWTWASRRTGSREPVGRLLRRALLFNASVAVGFLVNSLAFWAVHRLVGLPPVLSVLAATAVSATVSYLVSSRLVFVHAAPPATTGAPAPDLLPGLAPVPAPSTS